MKKLLLLFVMCIGMLACNGNYTKQADNLNDSDSIVLAECIDTVNIDTIDFE